ncbi:hypothetical protein JOQ06_023307 [Pogonophryne albipinna]|uniref:Uncharacterized protein n=1 Tax=Pogonophryne albipinna TaxID=1090488 RepID=A0AAD6BKX9_9TELE|nr:hypothetical protein JOQ06_023307 [Pogonophryne albipinna]
MVAYLFEGSFKKQAKFLQFARQLKEPEPTTTLTFEILPNDCLSPTCSKREAKVWASPENNQGSITTSVRRSSDIISVSGQEESSIGAHTQVLKRQYLKAQPDSCIVTNAMTKTFQWRRKEEAEGVRADTIANKYPFLKTLAGLCEEMNRIHDIENLQHRFREEFLPILPKVLALAKGKSPLEKIYLQAREESLSEYLPAMDFKAGLILLPIIFKEKHHCTYLGYTNLLSILYLAWHTLPDHATDGHRLEAAFTRRGPSVVKTDGFELCRASEEGVIAAFCAYFVFNMAYPPNRKNTLTFVQRCILKISEEGDKPLSTTVIRILNLLY